MVDEKKDTKKPMPSLADFANFECPLCALMRERGIANAEELLRTIVKEVLEEES